MLQEHRKSTGSELTPSVLPNEPTREDMEEFNVVQARVGRWQGYLKWRPFHGQKRQPQGMPEAEARPARRWTGALAYLAIFLFGFVVAVGAIWELVPYIETTRIVGELARLKMGGPLCVVVGLGLYLVLRLRSL